MKATTKQKPDARLVEAARLVEQATALLREAAAPVVVGGVGPLATVLADALVDAHDDLDAVARGATDLPLRPRAAVTHAGLDFAATGRTGRHPATRRRSAEYAAGARRVWAFHDGTVNEDDAGPVAKGGAR